MRIVVLMCRSRDESLPKRFRDVDARYVRLVALASGAAHTRRAKTLVQLSCAAFLCVIDLKVIDATPDERFGREVQY